MPEQKKLTMEEKRNLQKLIFSDIQSAGASYKEVRRQAREELQKRLVEHAPSTVVALADEHKRASENLSRVEKELSNLGYTINSYPERALAIAYGKCPSELVAFDEETSRTDKRLSDLKRDYTLRLFAGGEEAKELFATLGAEIAQFAR